MSKRVECEECEEKVEPHLIIRGSMVRGKVCPKCGEELENG